LKNKVYIYLYSLWIDLISSWCEIFLIFLTKRLWFKNLRFGDVGWSFSDVVEWEAIFFGITHSFTVCILITLNSFHPFPRVHTMAKDLVDSWKFLLLRVGTWRSPVVKLFMIGTWQVKIWSLIWPYEIIAQRIIHNHICLTWFLHGNEQRLKTSVVFQQQIDCQQ